MISGDVYVEGCSFDVQPFVLVIFHDFPLIFLTFSSQPKTNTVELSFPLILCCHTSVLFSMLLCKSVSHALLFLSIHNILQNPIDSHPEILPYKSVFQSICKSQTPTFYPYDNFLDKPILYPAKSRNHVSPHA